MLKRLELTLAALRARPMRRIRDKDAMSETAALFSVCLMVKADLCHTSSI